MFQTIGDFYEYHAILYPFSIFVFLILRSLSFLFLVIHPSLRSIHCESGLTNRDHEVGKNRSPVYSLSVVFGYETPRRPFSYTPLTLFRSLILWSVDRLRVVVVRSYSILLSPSLFFPRSFFS